jgi:hypothetical protein
VDLWETKEYEFFEQYDQDGVGAVQCRCSGMKPMPMPINGSTEKGVFGVLEKKDE